MSSLSEQEVSEVAEYIGEWRSTCKLMGVAYTPATLAQWLTTDSGLLDRLVAARVAAAREEAAAMVEALPAEMDAAWGGDAAWLTTGTKVAALVSDWLDELAADIRKGADRG